MPLPDHLDLDINNFEESVLTYVDERGMTFIEAVLFYCEENKMDPEYVKHLMTDPIKNKLEAEYRGLNMLPSEEEELPFE